MWQRLKDIGLGILFFVVFGAFLVFIIRGIFLSLLGEDMRSGQIIKGCFGLIVLIIKLGVFLTGGFYSPLLVAKIVDTTGKKWIEIPAYILLLLLLGVAVFWNIQDNPMRAWNPMWH